MMMATTGWKMKMIEDSEEEVKAHRPRDCDGIRNIALK